MQKTLMTAALVLAFSCHAWAGIMHTPGSPQPQPTPTPESAMQEPTAEATTEDGTQGTYMQVALELLAVLPSVL